MKTTNPSLWICIHPKILASRTTTQIYDLLLIMAVCTKVPSYLEQGQRLENLFWRLGHYWLTPTVQCETGFEHDIQCPSNLPLSPTQPFRVPPAESKFISFTT
ncbi:hypothetical protein BD769DRAFT_1382636 [Suillus cothurnatus]|nr:hypothetical protein BD769DRAFT_1382636 [Suillus cothurnatus]